ncbi:MAG: YbaK/EbsC family protein [Methylococcaceae bacterium]|jgi:Cys-tRNA(Pro)/Cys-tRNA(Cys) deacylase
MTENLDSPVTRQLHALGINYELIEIPLDPDKKLVRSLEELLAGQNRNPGQIVRSLLFRTGSGDFVLLAVAGGGKADWGMLRKHLNERRLTMAQPEEVLEATGFPIGAVPPVALPKTVRVLVDASVFEFERVVIGSGVLGYALDVTSAGLRQALAEAEIGLFVKQ